MGVRHFDPSVRDEPVSVTSGAGPHRLDRTLRITAGILGIVVAIPSFLAFLFVVLFVWLGSEDTPIWLAVPLGLLAIVQLYLAIRTLSARLATAVAAGLLGVLELTVGIVLLVASPTLLPATVAAIVVMFLAGVVALAAAIRIHRRPGSEAAPAPVAATRKSAAKKSGRRR
jgi:FtsH-binding integral membrane protein